MQPVRPDGRSELAPFYASGGVPPAHCAQIQTFPRASAGIDASTAWLMVAVMHQHDSAPLPAATAHSLGLPHRGHLLVSLGSGCSVI